MINIKHSKKPAKDIATRLRDIRLDARLTQKEMSQIVGLTPGSVGAMENGLYTPNYDVLRAIKSRLNVSYDYIIDGIESPVNNSQMVTENKELKLEIERLKKIIDKLVR